MRAWWQRVWRYKIHDPKYVLDTHTLVWYLEGSPRLSTRAKAIVDDLSSQLVVPIIALAEAAFLVERGRIAITSVPNLLNDVQADPRRDGMITQSGLVPVIW